MVLEVADEWLVGTISLLVLPNYTNIHKLV